MKKERYIVSILILFILFNTTHYVIAETQNYIVLSSSGSIIYSAGVIIVDDTEAIYVGTWGSSSIINDYYGSGYRYRWAGSGSNTATWSFTIPQSGSYEVYARWTEGSNRATDAPYTIYHADGSTTVDMNQEANGGQWVSLGVYDFNVGSYGVVLSDDANDVVIADAIRVVSSDIPPPVYYVIHLESEENTATTNNLGSIIFDGTAFGLPDDISEQAATYTIEYQPADDYGFTEWQTSGGVTVLDSTSNPTSATVAGNGEISVIYEAESSPPPPPNSNLHKELRGGQWFRDYSFLGSEGTQSIQELKEKIPDCNYVSFDVFIDSDENFATPRHRNEEELAPAIQLAKNLGFNIYMRIQPRPTAMLYTPNDVNVWFPTYIDSVLYWAEIAEENGVDIIAIGTELTNLEGYNSYWRSLIQKVRQIFSGGVTYNTNFWYTHQQFQAKLSASWFGDLDYIAVSLYWPLATGAEPSVNEVIDNWHSYVGASDMSGEDLVEDHLKVLSNSFGKDIIVISGLSSAVGACETPWDWEWSEVSLTEQANWYEAIYRVFSDKDWIAGYMWDGLWFTDADKNPNNTEFSVQNKPAEEITAIWYSNQN